MFVAVQRARTFGEQQRIAGMVSVIADKLAGIGATADQVTDVLGISPDRDTRHVFLRLLADQEPHIDHYLNKDWYLIETTADHPCYVSDNPVVLQNSNDFAPYGNLGLEVRGIEIYLPLSSTLMLDLYSLSIREGMLQHRQDIEFLLARAPHLIPAHMPPLEMLEHIQRFKEYLPFPPSQKNVIRYNSLQVQFSEQYVFCERKDFTLVEEMLADDERYRTGPRFTAG